MKAITGMEGVPMTRKKPITPEMEQLIEGALHATPGELDEKIDEMEDLIHRQALADVHRRRWLFYLIGAAEIAFFAFVLVGIVLIVWKYGYGG